MFRWYRRSFQKFSKKHPSAEAAEEQSSHTLRGDSDRTMTPLILRLTSIGDRRSRFLYLPWHVVWLYFDHQIRCFEEWRQK